MNNVDTNTPQLRFPEFDGEWDATTLNEVASFSRGKGISKADIQDDGSTPCIRYGELYTYYDTIIDKPISATNIEREQLKLSVGGEVIIPASGEDARDMATACAVINPNIALGSDLNILTGDFEAPFLATYLSGKKRLNLARFAQGISVVHLYGTQIASLKISLPTLPEQKKIAAFLGAIDDKIAQLTRKKELLTDYKKGCMQQLFSQKLRFKDDNGSDFPDWEEILFDEVAELSKRKYLPDRDPDSPVVVELENIEAGTGRIIGISAVDGQKSAKNRFDTGDVLFGKLRPYLKKFALPTFSGVCSTEIWVLRGKAVVGTFLYYLVQSEQFLQLAKISAGSKMPRAVWAVIADSEFLIPHPDEQKKIADFLSSIDAKIDLVGKELDHAKTFKKGLLQQMFV